MNTKILTYVDVDVDADAATASNANVCCVYNTDSLCTNVCECVDTHTHTGTHTLRIQSELYCALDFSFRALISCSRRAQLLGRNHRKIDSNRELKKTNKKTEKENQPQRTHKASKLL